MTLSSAPRLAVVVGTYNRFERLRACVESIRAQTRTPFVTHVVDAGSTDGAVEWLRGQAGPDLVPHFQTERVGQARALNPVLRTLDADYVAWLSDDNVLVDGGLDRAVAMLEADAKIGMVGLKLRDVSGPHVHAPYLGAVSTYGVLNVNQGVLRREIFESVGFFSEEFRSYGIDIDLTAKVLLAGADIVYTRNVHVLHHRDWAVESPAEELDARNCELEAALAKAQALYAERFPLDAMWYAKRAMWGLARRAFPQTFAISSEKKVLGLLPRDWSNIAVGRRIGWLDAVTHRDAPYHLRQRGVRARSRAPGQARGARVARRENGTPI